MFFTINLLLRNAGRYALLYESFTAIEYLLFAGFLHVNTKSRSAKNLLVILSLSFTIFFFVYTYAFPKEFRYIDSVPIGIETILILIFSFFYLYEQINDTTTLFLYNRYTFWVILGMVLYLAGSFFIYIFTNFLTPKEVLKYWPITNFVSILKNIFFCIAIYINAQPKKEDHLYQNLDLSHLN